MAGCSLLFKKSEGFLVERESYVSMKGKRMTGEKESAKAEKLIFLLFIASVSVVACFHEPWLDEAQAWMISRESSLWDILFIIPHTEGHPPLWHLMLFPLAHANVPFEIGIKGIAVVVSAAAAGLVLFRSPFPRGVRCLLPFTYFFFYQYGVISRPYGLMLLAFLLAAGTYTGRNEKPWRHVLSLALLCLTSAYGIVFAGGICIVWLLEIWQKRPIVEFMKEFLHDRRFFALLFLLLLAVCLILEIMPGEDTYTRAAYYENGMLFKILFLFLALPAEALAGQCLTSYSSIGNVKYSLPSFAIELVLGILLWGLFVYYGRKKKKLLLLVVPVFLFDVFACAVYMYIHHIGLLFLYLVFWYWVCLSQPACSKDSVADPVMESRREESAAGSAKKFLSEKDRLLLCRAGKAIPYLLCIVSVCWSLSASFLDIRGNYGYGRGVVNFLREHNMMECKIIAEWKSGRNPDGRTYYSDSNCFVVTIAMMPYLSREEMHSLVQHREQPGYNTNIPADEKKNRQNYQTWASQGIPDVVIGTCEIGEVYGGKVSMADYTPVAEIPTGFIWKNLVGRQYLCIYLRTDLLGQYHMAPLAGRTSTRHGNGGGSAPAGRE